jgi:hypothetical protein
MMHETKEFDMRCRINRRIEQRLKQIVQDFLKISYDTVDTIDVTRQINLCAHVRLSCVLFV